MLRSSDPRTLARLAAGGLLVGLGGIAAAGWALRLREVRFVVYEALPWPNGPWLGVSLLAFGAALLLAVPWVWRIALVTLGCCGCAAAVLWLMLAASNGAGRGTEAESYPAPNAKYRLVVHEGGYFDPVYFLSIEQRAGVLSRSWYLGCLDGDHDWIEEARWEAPGLFRARTSGEEAPIRIQVDLASGRPLGPPLATGCEHRP